MAITLTINGDDKTPYLFADEFGNYTTYTSALGARKVGNFVLAVPDSDYLPEVGWEVILTDNGAPVCFGSLDSYTQERLGDGYWLECVLVGLEQRLDKRFITLQAVDLIENIVGDILTLFADEGISGGTITPTVGIGTIQVKEDNTRVSDFLDSLATLANYIWYIDNTGALNFVPRATFIAPFGITDDPNDTVNAHALRNTTDDIGAMGFGDRIIDRTDLRSRETVQGAYEFWFPEVETWPINVGIYQLLNKYVGKIVSMTETNSTQAYSNLAFSGIPSDGDTVTVDTTVYTFRTAINNQISNEVLIGVDVASCSQNLFYAIVRFDLAVQAWNGLQYTTPNGLTLTGDPTVIGTKFSWPTLVNYSCTAYPDNSGGPVWSTLIFVYKLAGAIGNGCVLSTTSSVITVLGNLANGVTGDTQTVVSNPSLTPDTTGNLQDGWYYLDEAGYQILRTGTPAAAFIQVAYYPLGSDRFTVQDDSVVAARAAIEGGSGITEIVNGDTQNTDNASVQQEAIGFLAAYKTLNDQVIVTIDEPGLFVGMLVNVTLGYLGLGGSPPAQYMVQQIDTTKIGKGAVWAHFRYKVTMISTTRIGTWLQFWQVLAAMGTSGSGNGTTSGTGGSGGGGGGTPFITLQFGMASGKPALIAVNNTTFIGIIPPSYGGWAPSTWTADLSQAASGSDIKIDLYQNGGLIYTIDIPAGIDNATGSITGITFSSLDTVWGVVSQVGFSSAGAGVSILIT